MVQSQPSGSLYRCAVVVGFVVAAFALAMPPVAGALGSQRTRYSDDCEPRRSGEQCGPGNGRQTSGGGEKVSHKGWPSVTGILWKVLDSGAHRKVGGEDNDELLGHHGSDKIAGGPGKDIIWGDWDPSNNNTRQRDVLRGGAGNDWLYSSHGHNTILGGPGRDYVWAYYGRGVIDCGPGTQDTVRVRLDNEYTIRNCERVKNFCGFGSKPGGGCYKPGEKPTARRANTSHDGWPQINGMLLMNKLDQDRPLDARPGHDPFGGEDPTYSCDGLHRDTSCLGESPDCSIRRRYECDVQFVVPQRRAHNELLGGHGNDTIHAGPAGDVLWGDYKPDSQPEGQRDSLWGGDGRDFIYASHGRNTIKAGAGADWIKAHYGRGTIDCGAGNDLLYISRRAQRHYRLSSCETVSHKTLGY